MLRAYLGLTALAPGLLAGMARRAHSRQGADPARLPERMGHPSAPRPGGPVIWVHAASVGEVASVMDLATELAQDADASLLITTTTQTGAQTAVRRMPKGAVHQFQPIDTTASVTRFLDHWRPDLALFVEADLWPRTIAACTARAIPMALLNARPSRSRQKAPRLWRALLSPMAVITAQTPDTAAGLVALGLNADRVTCPGNLKADLAPQPVDAGALAALRDGFGDRPVWAAVSTHPGEEALLLDAQAGLGPNAPALILMPRHPERGPEVAQLIQSRGMAMAQRSTGARPNAQTQVYLADTLGETGLAYALTGLVFLGGSLLPGPGGHTPFEPAAAGAAILHGPHVDNFADAFAQMNAAGAARQITDAEDLAKAITQVIASPARAQMQQAAHDFMQGQRGARERSLALLHPLLTRDNPDPSA